MPIMSAAVLSGSTNGQDIAIIATASPGTTIHTVSSATNGVIEDVYIHVRSQATTDRVFTLESCGTATTFRSEHLVPAQTMIQVMAGQRFSGATGLVIKGFATATGGLLANGAVNKAVP